MVKKEKEIWKTYPKYPFIQASNLGRVRTKDRTVTRSNGRKYHVKGRVLKQQLNNMGYMYVVFGVNGKHVHLLVHRIVATCFLLNPNNLPEVNHIDNDPTNNCASNLEWCTSKYNSDYKKNFGSSSAQVLGRPVIAVNLETSEVLWFESQHEAERQLGVDQRNISAVVKGKRNKTGDYWFCYADEDAVEKTRAKFGDKIANKVGKLMNEHHN